MSRRTYDLPSLSTLATFEAAARHLSFKNAAVELNVTPGAVSHQIKALELELGTALFKRVHRGVELTGEGGNLFATLAESFYQISQQLRSLRENKGEQRVKIGTSSAVANLWTAKTLAGFWRAYPEVIVDQIVSDEGFGIAPPIDMYVRYGKEHRSDWDQEPLYRDDLVPLASPAMAETLHGASLDVLASQRLIHLEQRDFTWTTWRDWFTAHGYSNVDARGFRVNDYMVGLHAAIDGMGLILGWKRLVSPLIESGNLAVVEGFSLEAPRRFYLISRPVAELTNAARTLRSWLLRASDEHNSPEA